MPRKSTKSKTIALNMSGAAADTASLNELSAILASVGGPILPDTDAAPLGPDPAGDSAAVLVESAAAAAPELPAIDQAQPASPLAELGSLLAQEGVDLGNVVALEGVDEPASQTQMPSATDAATPASGDAVKAAAEKAKAEKKAQTEEEKARKKAEREAKKAEAASKPPAAPRIFFGSNTVGRLQHTLASALADYTLFELKDAEGDVAAKSAENLNAIKELGTKVQKRVTYILEFAAGKSKSLNSVIATALHVLNRDGFITTGDSGNLMKELEGRYSLSSARAMANNSVLALKFLCMVTAAEKQRMVANPQSTLLPVVMAKLAPAAAEQAAA